MKKEQHALAVSTIINIIASFLKVIGGIFCGSYTLMVSGYYTICNFITDIMAMVGARVGKKRANKKYPFGYGKREYSLQIGVGVIIVLVGLYIIIRSFFLNFSVPNLKILYLLLFILLLKVLNANYLMQKGNSISSTILITNSKESFIDILSILLTICIIIISRILPVIDLLGCLIIAIIIIYEGSKIILENILLIIGEDDNNKEIKNNLKKIINKEASIEYSDSFLIKTPKFYQATIEIGVDEILNIKELILLEIKLKKSIKKNNKKIKYIDFNIIKK